MRITFYTLMICQAFTLSLLYECGLSSRVSFAATSVPINQSSLRIIGPSETLILPSPDRKGDVSLCQGAVPEGVDLKPIRYTAHDLKTMGTNCVFADFDGNGYLDFVLYDSSPQKFLVLYFDKKNVIRTQVINNVSAPLVIFDLKDSDRKDYPKFLHNPGLIAPGANGDVGYVFFYNQKSGLLEKAPYVYHEDSGVD